MTPGRPKLSRAGVLSRVIVILALTAIALSKPMSFDEVSGLDWAASALLLGLAALLAYGLARQLRH